MRVSVYWSLCVICMSLCSYVCVYCLVVCVCVTVWVLSNLSTSKTHVIRVKPSVNLRPSWKKHRTKHFMYEGIKNRQGQEPFANCTNTLILFNSEVLCIRSHMCRAAVSLKTLVYRQVKHYKCISTSERAHYFMDTVLIYKFWSKTL